MSDKDSNAERRRQSLTAARNDAESVPPAAAAPNRKKLTLQSRPAPTSTGPGTEPPSVGNVAAKLSPRTHAQSEQQVKIKDKFDYDVALNLAFIGTGQGGGRVADAFHRLGYRRVCAFNTTDMDFGDLTTGMKKHSLDVGGAAKDIRLARDNLVGREDEVTELLTAAWGDDVDRAMVCVCLGGGTGSGTCAQLVEIARRYTGKPVGAVVSLPTVNEGYQICRNAVLGLRELIAAEVTPLLILDNHKIYSAYRPAANKAHRTANKTVSQLFHLFNRLAATHEAVTTFDVSELTQLLDSGIVAMGATDIQDIETPADVSRAVRDVNVLVDVDLSTGMKAACLFVGHADVLELGLEFFEAGYTQLANSLAEKAILHRGLYLGADAGLQCYTLIADLALPVVKLADLSRTGGLLDDEGSSRMAAHLGI